MTSGNDINENHIITIREAHGGAKVHPPIERVKRGDTVEFSIDDFESGYIFFYVEELFGVRQVELPLTVELKVQTERKGVYPYSPVVKRRTKHVVAEGNSMPFFVMD